MRRGIQGVLAFASLLGVLFAIAPNALAVGFTVNSTGDGADVGIDGVCDADPGAPVVCTLRAAIEEASANNNEPTVDTVGFVAAFNGEVADTISPPGSLPIIAEALTVDGGNCPTMSLAVKPCVGIDLAGSASEAFDVQASNVTVRGFAIFDGGGISVGIRGTTNMAGTTSGLTIQNNWFGIDLAQTEDFVPTGVFSSIDSTTVGGTAATQRNVFASGSDTGLRLEGADNATVQGNYIGTLPDGSTQPTTRYDQGITLVSTILDTATGSAIGGAEAGSATTCDGACNVIGSWDVAGVQLDGLDFPAGQTTMRGNFIGLAANGSADLTLLTTGLGIDVGGADSVTIGGPAAADRNYVLNAIEAGVDMDEDPQSLVLQNNYLGLNPAGTARVGEGGSLVLGTPGTPIGPATLDSNRVASGNASIALNLRVHDTAITGNTVGVGTGGEDVGGGFVGLVVFGPGADDNTIGGTTAAAANVIGNVNGTAINLFDADDNTISGNFVGTDSGGSADHGNVSAGIGVSSGSNNTIGGTTAAGENVISNTAILSQANGDAIEVEGDGADGNRILRNRGAGNDGLFVDLKPIEGPGAGPNGPNGDIAAPVIGSVSTSQASGSGAVAGATVRVYRTVTTGGQPPHDIASFVGAVTADGSGNWSLTCPSAECVGSLGGSDRVTANQTSSAGNSSELAPAVFNNPAPETTISAGPAAGSTIADNTPEFSFTSNEGGATFECKVDSSQFSPCQPGLTIGPLDSESHTFQVRARDGSGQADPTPDSRTFTVDGVPPETVITVGPATESTITDPTATFEFSATEAGSSFECSLDGAAFSSCTSPVAVGPLDPGAHQFRVRATDSLGNVDTSPAFRNFNVSVSAPPADTVIDLDVEARKVQRGRRAVVVFGTCAGEACTIRASGRVNVPGTGSSRAFRLKGDTKTAAAGERVKLVLRFSRKLRKAVKRALRKVPDRPAKKVRARVTVTATDAAGNSDLARPSVRIR